MRSFPGITSGLEVAGAGPLPPRHAAGAKLLHYSCDTRIHTLWSWRIPAYGKMKLLELTLPTVAENLALDEALLDVAEAAAEPRETLRLWESPEHAVIVGRSSRIAAEVNLSFCRSREIRVFRRCSGGAAVVIGSGCLMYAVVLSHDLHPGLRFIEHAHEFVLEKICAALRRCGVAAQRCGTSDLAIGDQKISGNSLRCKRQSLLYHGTILYGLSGELIQQCLCAPPRQPEYRRARSHADFITQVPLAPQHLRDALVAEWQPAGLLRHWPRERTSELAEARYRLEEWNYRL